VDILVGQGANLDSVTTTQISSPFSAVLNSKLRITVTNAGASNKGQVIVYFSDDASCSIADSSITGEKLAAELWTELGDSITSKAGSSLGDITSVTAGDWLTGGGTTGAVTLNVDSSKAASKYYVGSQGFLTSETYTGDIEGVTAGDLLSGGGTSGTVTLNVDTTKAATQYDLTEKLDKSAFSDSFIVYIDYPDSAALYDSLHNAWQDNISDSLTLAKLQALTSSDFHNLGGTDANTTYTADGTTLDLTGTTFGVADNGIGYAQIDTGATGFVDARKFGAVADNATDNVTYIRAALSYLNKIGGGTLFFPAGNDSIYLVGDSCQVRGNIRIVGNGGWIKRKDGIVRNIFEVMDGANNMVFENLKLDLNFRGQGSTDLSSNILIWEADNTKIIGCTIKNGSYAIRSASVNRNTTVKDCIFDDCYEAVMLYECRDVTIENNYSYCDLPEYPTGCNNFGGGIALFNTIGGLVADNTIIMPDSIWETTEQPGIAVSSQGDTTSGIIVRNNKIYCREAYQFGITQHVSYAMYDITIEGNFISGATTIGGIELNTGETECVNNTVIDCSTSGIVNNHGPYQNTYNVLISGNKIKNCEGSGIAGVAQFQNSEISNNIIENVGAGNNSAGIYIITNGTNNTVSDNIIFDVYGNGMNFRSQNGMRLVNNLVDSTTSPQLYMGADTSCIVLGNTFKNAQAYGISISGSVGCQFIDNIVEYNYGIYCSESTSKRSENLVIHRNKISDIRTGTNYLGIRAYNLYNSVISNNYISNWEDGGIGIFTSTADTARNNVIHDNFLFVDDISKTHSGQAIRVEKCKKSKVLNNRILIKGKISEVSYTGVIRIGGNSDSTIVEGNYVEGDSVEVPYETGGIYLSNENQDFCQIKNNFIRNFKWGINIANARATNIVDDNQVLNATTPYIFGGAIVGRIVEEGMLGIGKEPDSGIELDVSGDIAVSGGADIDSINVDHAVINTTLELPDSVIIGADLSTTLWTEIKNSADAAISAISWSGDLAGTGTNPAFAANSVQEAEINWGGVDPDSLTEAIRDANIYQSQTFTFLQPDSIREVVTDSLVFFCFDDLAYPNGAKLGKVRITTSAAVTDTIALYEYSTRAGASISVIDSFMLSSAQDAESLAVDLNDSDMAVDSWLCLDLSMWDATCKTLEITIVYYIKPGD
jgi:parallel beta-helix repeat protein